jgi:hypothetical protein
MADRSPTRRRRFPAIGGYLLLAVVLLELLYLSARWPFTQERVLRALGRATHTTVTAKAFDSNVVQPGCTVRNVTFTSASGLPIAKADAIHVRSSWMNLLLLRKEVRRMEVLGLHTRIPGNSWRSQGGGTSEPSKVVVRELVADGATLGFVSGGENSRPLEFGMRKLRITNLGPDRRVGYSALIRNPHPPGELRVEGFAGPVASGGASMTPVSGVFELRDADLNRYDGVGGILGGKGGFSGPLAKVRVAGTAAVRGFEVNNSGKPVDLEGSYRALVNGQTGDIELEWADARFLSTYVRLTGSVRAHPESSGKTVQMDFVSREARIDDLLLVFTRSKVANLEGPMKMRGNVALPMTGEAFLRRLRLQGVFDIDNARWTRSRTQNKMEELSARARGDKEEFKNNGALAQPVVTDLSGSVAVRDGVAMLRDIVFEIPGALASGGGTYNLVTKRVDLNGRVRMSADVSEATSGIKSVLLRPFNALFRRKRNDPGATLSVSIVGTYPRPQYKVGMTP